MNGQTSGSILARIRSAVQPAWRSLLERLRRGNTGQALVMVTVMFMVLIGFAAIATDTGMLWMNRRSLQNSADAAALAGVQALPNDVGGATTAGCVYATEKNAVPGMVGKAGTTCGGKADLSILTTYFANDTIKVTAYKTINPIFGMAVGFGSVEIGATAKALVGSVGSACGVPLFQTEGLLTSGGVWGSSGVVLNKPTIMKTSDSASGNFLALQLPSGSSSASDFRNSLANGAACAAAGAAEYSGSATTNPGNMVGPLDQGMKDRETAWTAQGNCPSKIAGSYLRSDGNLWKFPLGTANNTQLTPSNCYRLIVVPVLDANISTINGSTSLPIKGFAMFYISNWCGNQSTPKVKAGSCDAPGEGTGLPVLKTGELWGYYVGFNASSEDYIGYNGLGTKVYALVD
jgi:Putative Flp pilus-assembly TadE/G-like